MAHFFVDIHNNLQTIENDIQNNKDTNTLIHLGSDIGINSFKNLCPLCKQKINDILLPDTEQFDFMTIDKNITHLEAQKKMFEFVIENNNYQLEKLKSTVNILSQKKFDLQRLAKSIRNDLYSIDDNISEAIIYKKIKLEEEINNINDLKTKLELCKKNLQDLSLEWVKILDELKSLPKENFTILDKKKLQFFQKKFIYNLETYGYKSITDLNEIKISLDTYLPTIRNFDMKFDSSASDNIRAIWAFTMSLLQTSLEYKCNHPGVIIFDEPNQHNIIPEDTNSFFKDILSINNTCQFFIGITLDNKEINDIDYIEEDKETYASLYGIIHELLLRRRPESDQNPKDRDAHLLTNAFLWDNKNQELHNPHFITTDNKDIKKNEKELISETTVFLGIAPHICFCLITKYAS